MSDLSHDSPGVQGLAQLGRNAIDRVSELERGISERDERLSSIERTVAVLKARLRACGQLLIEEIGADGPENADVTAERAAKTIRQLRAQLAEYERAPTVATVFDGIHGTSWEPYIRESEDVDLPPVGTELIARPARKGE